MSADTLKTISLSVIGNNTGDPYKGDFKIRTLLTLRQTAAADEARRLILGANSSEAISGIQNLAMAAGQLSVRIVEGPDWWNRAGLGGIDLEDDNILAELFKLCVEAANERRASILKDAEKAAESLKKDAK